MEGNQSPTESELRVESEDHNSFQAAIKELRQCQWYWGKISGQCAERLLAERAPGTFLLRDSRSDRYFFSFSYQTTEGCFHTHVGLHNGRFCLGGPNSLIRSNSLVKFVNKAMRSSRDKDHYNILMHPKPSNAQETVAPVDLQYPLARSDMLPSLKYLCRVVVRHALYSEADVKRLLLPVSLKRYVASSNYLSPL